MYYGTSAGRIAVLQYRLNRSLFARRPCDSRRFESLSTTRSGHHGFINVNVPMRTFLVAFVELKCRSVSHATEARGGYLDSLGGLVCVSGS